MIISQLIKKNNRMIIVFDTGKDIHIHYDVFIRNGLRRGDDLSDETVAALQTQSDLLYIKESALRLLGRRMHSIRELRQKLLQKKYQIELITRVIEDLCESGYVDDSAFAKQYAQEKISKKIGVQKIRNELSGKGISKDIITEVLSEIDTDLEQENAFRIAEKKKAQLLSRGIEGDKLKQKIYAFLLSKGYGYELIRDALEKLE